METIDFAMKPNDLNTYNGNNNDSIENYSNANNKMMSVNGNNDDDATLCTSSGNKHSNNVVAWKSLSCKKHQQRKQNEIAPMQDIYLPRANFFGITRQNL